MGILFVLRNVIECWPAVVVARVFLRADAIYGARIDAGSVYLVQDGDYRFFATRSNHRELHRAALDVEHSIGFAPCEKMISLSR